MVPQHWQLIPNEGNTGGVICAAKGGLLFVLVGNTPEYTSETLLQTQPAVSKCGTGTRPAVKPTLARQHAVRPAAEVPRRIHKHIRTGALS